MALFGFGKKKKEAASAPACCCKAGPVDETPKTENVCCGEKADGICCVKVLGAGCKACHEQFENAKKAVAALGLPIEVEYITDMPKVMEYGVMSMPAIVVNDRVVSQGRVLKAADVQDLLRKLFL